MPQLLRPALLLASASVAAAAVLPVYRPEDAPAHSLSYAAIGNLQGSKKLEDNLMSLKVSRTHAMVVTISVGTPPQELRCLLDSGSADLWVPSKRCQTCDTERFFHADRSSTFAPKLQRTPQGLFPRSVRISYGSGEIIGYDVQDTLHFGPFEVRNQSFVIVESAALPARRSWDGICGLGWNGLAQVGKPLYQQLQELGHPALFALLPAAGGSEARMAIGELPPGEVQDGSLVWLPAEEVRRERGRTFWVVSGGLAIRKDKPSPARFLVDTGTNQVLLVPPGVFPSLVRSLLPLGTFEQQCGLDGDVIACDCSVTQDSSLPPLRIYLGGRPFVLSVPDLFERADTTDGNEVCVLRIQVNHLASSGLPDPLEGLLGGSIGIPGLGPMPASPGMPGAPASPAGEEAGPPLTGLPGLFPLPFSLPPLFGGSDRLRPGMPWPDSVSSTQVEEVTETRPDGSVCTTTLEYQGSKLTHNVTRCSQRSTDEATRRLQLMPMGMPMGMPMRMPMGMPMGMPLVPVGMQPGLSSPMLSRPRPEDELWVLGGVFLERFITVFDFDQARLGFAEAVGRRSSLDTLGTLSPSQYNELAHRIRTGFLAAPGGGDVTKAASTALALVAGASLLLWLGLTAVRALAKPRPRPRPLEAQLTEAEDSDARE